jgi:hypothetical protein
MITYPLWWEGLRWEMTRLMRDLFTHPANAAANGLTGVKVERFLSANDDIATWLEGGDGYIMVHRNGGHLDTTSQPWVDNAIVTLAGLTMSPDESHDLMDYVTTVLISYQEADGGIVHRSAPHRCGLTTTSMTVPGEVVAPQMIPEQFRDERLVPMVWAIHADVPRGLPNYRAYLGLDTD